MQEKENVLLPVCKSVFLLSFCTNYSGQLYLRQQCCVHTRFIILEKCNFGLIFIFCTIELIFGRLTCFDMKIVAL